MIYKTLGLMSGSSLDGLDIAFVEFHENSGAWSFEIKETDCYSYLPEWKERLKNATSLNALDYQLLHVDYGHYLGQQVKQFIEEKGLQFQVSLISSHGHTTFHVPSRKMTAQLGDGAAIAAETGLPVVSDLRALDLAFGGQGAPIVPIGEKFLFKDYSLFLNLGGIANISFRQPDNYIAFDICPANRVLDLLAGLAQKDFDEGGLMASRGNIDNDLLEKLNELDYYKRSYPKSLPNQFGTEEIFPLIKSAGISINDALRTYVEHIVFQIHDSISTNLPTGRQATNSLLVTGGGAFNDFLIEKLKDVLNRINVEVVIPDKNIVSYKEALIMAFIGVLRWRQEYTVISTVTGAERNSIGGAVWIGQEA